MSVLEEPMTDVLFAAETTADAEALARNEAEILRQNMQAMTVDTEAMSAFLDLLSGADTEYLAAEEYVPEPETPELDWDAVSAALGESQKILIGVQSLLSETLAAMGVEDHAYIRVFQDIHGDLRLVAAHPRQAEIEAALNSPENAVLRELYEAATAGMSLAGSLVGTMSVPTEVLERVKRKVAFAA